jgi:ATP-dependent protease ClpP protease subunit
VRPRALVRAGAPRPQARTRPTNETTSEETLDLLLYGVIGWGIWVEDILRQLSRTTATRIRVSVNSPGGDAFDGIALYNALAKHPAHVRVEVDGLAASAASVIAMAGDEIVMGTGATMMIHDASVTMQGSASELRQAAETLDTLSEGIAAIYARRAGGDPGVWREAMLAETWLSGEEAVEAGLATTVAALDQHDGDGNGGGAEAGSEDEATDQVLDLASSIRASWTWDGRDAAPPPTRLLRHLHNQDQDRDRDHTPFTIDDETEQQRVSDLRAALATLRR